VHKDRLAATAANTKDAIRQDSSAPQGRPVATQREAFLRQKSRAIRDPRQKEE
jgi:hypothetical protein